MRRLLLPALLLLAAAPGWAMPDEAASAARLSAEDRAAYKAAFEQAAAKQYGRSHALARRAHDRLPAKVLLWLELTEPGVAGDFAQAAEFLVENPEWPGQIALQQRTEVSMPLGLRDADVLAWFKARPPITLEGASLFAEALLRAGAAEQAAAVLRSTWIERDFPEASEHLFRARYGTVLRREDELARLDRLLWDGQKRAALRQAQRLGGGYPALAEARLQLAGMQAGVDAAIRRVPADLMNDPGLTLERARWRQRKDRYEGVIELLDPPHPEAPRPEAWWPLRQWAARQAFARGDLSVAYRIASQHGLETGVAFAEAEWLAGWLALRFLDEPERAYRHFTRLFDGVGAPISLARAAYWAGEAARALNRHRPADEQWQAVARGWYAEAEKHKTAFYGQLAAERLGLVPSIELAPLEPGDEARTAFEARELVQVARLLAELEQTKLLERFLSRLSNLAAAPEDYVLVADLAQELGRTDLAVRTAKAARMEGIILAEYLFPLVALPVGEEPEPALVLAVIRQESGFYGEAVSRAGAQGLMQLLPGTAQRVARDMDLDYRRGQLLEDPHYNLRLGRAYLADLTQRYNGSYILALAAYNAGPTRANEWIRTYGDPRQPEVDPIDWVESIPFSETRNYVQRILEGLVIYRQYLGAEQLGPDLGGKLRGAS